MRKLVLVLALVLLPLSSACGPSATDLPLPGGGISGKTYTLNVEFADVLNLPQKAKVTLGGVDVGQVRTITVSGSTATVKMAVLADVAVPRGTRFELRQATVLGEVFIALEPPARPSADLWKAGDTVPLGSTGNLASMEDILAAFSVMLTGGGLNHVKTSIRELNRALSGNVVPTHQLLHRLRYSASVLRSQTTRVREVVTLVDRLARRTVANRKTIDALLRDLSPAVGVISAQTRQLVTMLNHLGELGDNGKAVLEESRADTVTMLADLRPVLDGFIALDADLAPVMRQMLAFHTAIKEFSRGSAGAGTLELRGVARLPVVDGDGGIPDLTHQILTLLGQRS